MERIERLHELRELLLAAPESAATRLVAVLLSIGLLAVVLWLVRSRRLCEEYTPIWVATGVAVLALSVRLDILRGITRAIGAWTPSATIFFLGEVFLVAICLNYAVRLSQMGLKVKNLAQEIALLRAEVEGARPAAGVETPGT